MNTHHMINFIAVLACTFSLLGIPAPVSAQEPMPIPWRDDFSNGQLIDPWFWVNENPAMWNLTENQGFLRINTSPSGTGGQNLLLRPVALGDFMIKTHLVFEPNANFQFAGLVLYQDDGNFLQFGRAYCDIPDACVGNGIYFDQIQSGGFVDSNFATPVGNPSEAYLRLQRRGDMVEAFFSYDGMTWIYIGTHWIPPDFQVNGVGVTSSQDYSGLLVPADFDFFELTEGFVNLPPVLQAVTIPVDPFKVNSTIDATTSFLDPDLYDSHTATWDWGDGLTSAGTVEESSQIVSGSHAYSQAGVYTVIVTLADTAGETAKTTFAYVVVFDPGAGFVTGGGWINSPVGAYTADPSLTGKATFGFVSKYKKGANVPTGNTEFQFKMASLNFSSTSYDWLVIAGAKAQYKGIGTINGSSNYRFMLTAIDGQVSGGGGVDKFRIKIWDLATDQLIYDNQHGAPDDALPTTALQGGSIVIHK